MVHDVIQELEPEIMRRLVKRNTIDALAKEKSHTRQAETNASDGD